MTRDDVKRVALTVAGTILAAYAVKYLKKLELL